MLTFYRQDHGQDLVEYALIFPLLMLLIFGIVEFGILFFKYNTIANAAREGARAGIIAVTATCDQSCIDAKVVAATKALAVGLNPTTLSITVTHPSVGKIKVTVSYATSLITGPLIAGVGGSGVITLQSVATMKTE